jgi:DNA (cytosine-5)-methyltransferase 1
MLSLISLFSGAGGLDLGFHWAGFQTIWANEFDKAIWATFQHNFPDTQLEKKSITQVCIDDIPQATGLIGGPPCQSWSEAGAGRGFSDTRGQLFADYIRVLAAKQPLFFVAENVSGILHKKHQISVDNFLRAFKQAGYAVCVVLVNANDFGVAQERHRVFFIGYRLDTGKVFQMPSAYLVRPTLEEAIRDLEHTAKPALEKNYGNLHLEIPNHEYWQGDFSSHYLSRNRVRTWQEPSFTIQASGRHAPMHPQAPRMEFVQRDLFRFADGFEHLYRRLSVREAARVQSFPDSFIFYYQNLADGYKMVGNAVPPKLAKVIAEQIRTDLFVQSIEDGSNNALGRQTLFELPMPFSKAPDQSKLVLTQPKLT